MPKTLDTLAAQALSKQLDKRATGRIYATTSAGTAGSGSVEVSVYVQDGAILAAEGTDDPHHFVRRLRVVDAITSSRTMDLISKVVRKKSIFGELIDGNLPPDVLDPILYDRFRDNLARFLGSEARPKFETTSGVFVDNLQVGLDTAAVIAEAATLWQTAATVPLDLDLAAGPTPAADGLERQLIDLLKQARVVTPLLARLPVEPIAGRAFIGGMLSRRVLRLGAEPLATDVRGVQKSLSPDEEMTERNDETEDAEDAATTGGPPVRRLASDVEDVDEVPDEEPVVDDEPVADSPSTAEPVQDSPSTAEAVGDTPSTTEPVEAESVQDPMSVTEDGAPVPKWMKGSADAEEDMDAFADHDENRGVATGAQAKGGPKGSFSTDAHNLDRVEVSDDLAGRAEPPPPQDDETPIPIDEAPQARFAAPTLTEEEAVEKITVANETLMHIVTALDGHEGAGGGRAALQLMLEGAPAKFQALFEGVAVGEDEELLDAESIIGNIATRPPTEHRRLLKDGLVDLIERALSHGADELSDEAVDAMLEATAGYRGRLGL